MSEKLAQGHRRVDRSSPRGRILLLLATLLVSLRTLPAAELGSVILTPGRVDAKLTLRLQRAVEAGTVIYIPNLERSVKPVLVTPFGERIGPLPEMTNFMMTEQQRPLKTTKTSAGEIDILFRAIKELPPGDYQILLTGTASWKQRVRPGLGIPDPRVRTPGRWARIKRGFKTAAFAIVASPILLPLLLSGDLPIELMDSSSSDQGSSQHVEPRFAEVSFSESNCAFHRYDGRFYCTGDYLIVHALPNTEPPWPMRQGRVFIEYRRNAESAPIYLEPNGVETHNPAGHVMTRIKETSTTRGSFENAIRVDRPGLYTLRIVLEGERLGGRKYTLETDREIEVADPSVQLLTMQPSVRRAQGSSDIESVGLRSELKVRREGKYLVVASLDRDTANPVCRQTRTLDLTSGQHSVFVEFGPEQVRACQEEPGKFAIPPIEVGHADGGYGVLVYAAPRGHALTLEVALNP